MGDIVKVMKGGRFVGWYVRFVDADGKRKQRASHQPTKELARRYLVEIEARVARGKVGLIEPAESISVGALLDRFLGEYQRPQLKPGYKHRATVALRNWRPALGKCDARSLTTGQVNKARDELLKKLAPGTVRVVTSYLKCVFAWALKGGIIERDPVKLVELPRLTTDSVEYLSKEEIRRLLAQCEGMLAVAVRVALHLGLRKGEIFGLRWRDLDLETRRITIARSFTGTPKSGKPRHLRLPAVLVPVLAEWYSIVPPSAGGLVFPIRGRMADRSETLELGEAMDRAGIRAKAMWHLLRHSFASHFVMAGGNILTLQKILGHATLNVTLVYAHLAPDFLESELDRVRY